MEYDFFAGEQPQHFYTVNQKNQLGFRVDPNGYAVYNLQSKKEEKVWSADFSINSIGRENIASLYNSNISIDNTPGSLTFHYTGAAVQYVNDATGLRQNFIITTKPKGTGKLQTTIKVESALVGANLDNNKIAFHTAGNNKDIKLFYDELKVWDAAGSILPATMSLNAATNIITISVDDQDAVYPVTIDPLNRVPEWTTSADGVLPALLTNMQLQVQTLYGFTVAGLGDINNDGYDDVAVSAPGMADVISGTGQLSAVGAVFIYLGSPVGLSTTPAKILQPTTAVDGALFGYSIDAGDITGDGINDIVISAPMDRYTTSASALLGQVNVEVTAGKVYMYRSEDLFSAPNPTPFLQIRLQGTGFFSTGILNILGSNVGVTPLFGFSVAVTKDLNKDNKADIIIGAPTYLGVELLAVQSGAAFVYYSNDLATTSPQQLETPDPTLLGLISLPIANTSGLLFGYSVDGAGDFDNDGKPDVVVGAPAGVDLSTLGGIFTGQFLGGSAYVFVAKSSGIGVKSTSNMKLQADPSGLLSNTANLFGYEVKGVKNASGVKTGGILIGAPAGAVITNLLSGLTVKAGQVHVFKKRPTSANGTFVSDQIISSPRSSSLLSILGGSPINASVLFGASIDNMLDVNCDNIGDIIVGEPLSSAIPLLGADVAGGAAYIFTGNPDGTYNTTPIWDLHAEVSPLLGVNATALIGFSVAGAGHIKGLTQGNRALVGGPSNSLDFGVGLLNLGNTLGTTFDFVFDDNGLGKSYVYSFSTCNATLPVTLVNFAGRSVNKTVSLDWSSVSEDNFDYYQLQRSTDGIRYETIVVAFAKNTQHNVYNYIDKLPYTGVNYYRLKMIDRDKKFTYSNIVTVRFDQQLQGDIVIAPNPVQSDINVRMTGLEKGIYRLELQNTLGQTFMTRTVTVNQFAQTETIQRNGAMATGIYWVNVYDNMNTKVKSIRILMSKQ